MSKVKIDRRQFVKIATLGGGGFALGIAFPVAAKAAAALAPPDCEFFQPSAFLRIDKNGLVTIFVAKQESGQGVNTSLPMIVAEELEVDFQKVKEEVAAFGSLPEEAHDTGGSQSVTGSWDELRKAGAVAKSMLVSAAAKRWGVNEGLCRAENGTVIHATAGHSFSYGELACEAAALPVPSEVTLKNIKDFKVIGKEQRKRSLRDILTGRAQYGMDLAVPGMAYAVVARCPVLGGSIARMDDSEARAVPGVLKIVQYTGTDKPMHVHAGVAVVATNTWAAMKARRLLKITWNEGAQNGESSAALFKTFAAKAAQIPAKIVYENGKVDSVTAPKSRTLTASYSAPFLTHATIEPPNFIAQVKGGQCELWGGLQLPKWAVDTIAADCGIPRNNIKVNLALMGGAFGRRLQCDFAIEAVKIAQQMDGQPVKVIWDRSDDLRFGNYRPANHHRLQAKWDAKGALQTWEHHVLTTPIGWMTDGKEEGKIPDENVGGAGADFWYAVPNLRMGYTPVDFNLQRGWLRGVEPVVNVFALECFVDEVARRLKKDPLAYRLSLLEGRPPFEAKIFGGWAKTVEPARLAAVLKLAAEKIGWSQSRAANRFVGIAGHMFFCDSYAAHAIEIEMVAPKKFRLVKIVATIDCGVVVNPDGLKNQLEGGTVFGLGQALRNEITVENSRVVQDSFFSYELARFTDVPPIEAYAVESTAKPGGAGEVAVATVSPALCNALAAAGQRPRRLPLQREGFEWMI